MCQTRIYLFVSLFLQKIWLPILASYKLELRICLFLLDVALNFSPAFQNTEAAFEWCFTKEVVQQNEVIKYNSPGQVVKGRRALYANLLKIALYHKYFSKNLSTSSEQFKTHLDGYFIGQLFFENVPKWLFLKCSCWLHIFYIFYRDVIKEERIFMDFILVNVSVKSISAHDYL